MSGHLLTPGPVQEAPPSRSAVRRLADIVLAPTPVVMRRIALAGIVIAIIIILSGAAVRLSQSGLGCATWPQCSHHSVFAGTDHGGSLVHQWVEFGNRLVTAAIFVIAVLVSVAAWQYKPEGRRRRDLVWLAAAQPAFIVVQAVVGGIVVLTKLNPGWVSGHYLASAALVVPAVGLYVRCQEGTGPARPLARREATWMARAVIGVVALMLMAGTVVTGSGPLAGAADVPRYPFPRAAVTQLHADIGWLILGLVVALVLTLRLSGAPRRATRLAWLLLVLVLVQGSIGYSQYFSGLPAGLVWFHEAGAAAIWLTALFIPYTLRDRGRAVPEA